MNNTISHRSIPVFLGLCIAGFSVGAFANDNVSASVGFTKTFSNAQAAPEHVCRYEERPVVKTYTDASGGRYEQHTTETVRVCEHTEVVAITRDRAPRRKIRRSNVNFSIGFYDGGHSHHQSHYYGHGGHYRDRHHYRPRRHYNHYDSHHGYRNHKKSKHRGRH